MSFGLRLFIFLLINFGVLTLGSITQGEGPFSDWYKNLNIAPWTPPGWVFGVAWTFIMITYSIYLAYLIHDNNYQRIIKIFVLQLVLNSIWNPLFFKFHFVLLGLMALFALQFSLIFMFFKFFKEMHYKSLFLLPYIIWIFIAISLNMYVIFNN